MAPRRLVFTLLVLALLLIVPGMALAAEGPAISQDWGWRVLVRFLLPWLLPLGVAMAALGTREPGRAHDLATALPLALVVAVGGYLLCGFGFQFGGIGLLVEGPETAHLTAEWSPLDLRNGSGWGLVGLRQVPFNPTQATETELALFLSQLALVTTATLIPLTSLHGRAPRLATWFACLLVSCLCYPLAGNWIHGGGWLTQPSSAYGLIDRGPGYPFLVGGCVALAGLVAFRRRLRPILDLPPALPRAHLPLYAMTGALLAFMGWVGSVSVQPIIDVRTTPLALLVSALGAIVGASAVTLFYGWLARGKADAGLSARGMIVGFVAISSALAGASFWSAALIGAVAGFLLAPVMFALERLARIDDTGAAVGTYLFPALWGLLAAGLSGPNQSVLAWTGTLMGAAQAGLRDLTRTAVLGAQAVGQFQTQLIGVGALAVLAFVIPWLVLGILSQAYALPAEARRRFQERALALQQSHEEQRIGALQRLESFWRGVVGLVRHIIQRTPRVQWRRLLPRQRMDAIDPDPETLPDSPEQEQA